MSNITPTQVDQYLESIEKRYSMAKNPLGIETNPFGNSLQMVMLRTKNYNRKSEIKRVIKNAEMSNPELEQHTNIFLSSYEINSNSVNLIAKMVYEYDARLFKEKVISKRHYSNNEKKSISGYARQLNRLVIELLEHTTKALRDLDDIDLMKLRNDIVSHIHDIHYIVLTDSTKPIHPKDIFATVCDQSCNKVYEMIEMFFKVKKAKLILSRNRLH